MSKQAEKMSRAFAHKVAKSHTALQKVIFLLVLMLAMAFAAIAQAQTFRFSTVVVEGNQRIETATILTYAGITSGEAVSAGAVNDAAQRIRAAGLFESVDLVPSGNRLVIRVVEYPTVSRINFEGNSRLSDDELSAVVRSQSRRVYSPSQAEQDVAAITEAYAQQGRINATVTPRIIRRSDNRVDLVFEVFEGGVSEVGRIGFVGNRSYSDRRLRGVLETKQVGIFRAIISRDTFVADRVDFDQQVLSDFYRSRGYVDFQVQNVDVSLTRERDAYLITYNIQEGQRFRFGNVSVISEIDEADSVVFEDGLHLRSGSYYSPTAIETNIARIERLAIRQGINFMRVEPRITRNDRDLTLDIEFVLVRGDRIFVERIDIEGNNTTLDRVVRNQFTVVEGDPFNPREIRQSAERIRALGYFVNADVDASEGSSPDQVVIDVNVEEGPTGSLSFGGNFSSDNGLSLLASFKQRNFLGRGQSLSFELAAGADTQDLSFSFTEPNFLARDLSFGLGLNYGQTDNANALYDTQAFNFRPSFAFPVSENGRLSVFYGYGYTDIMNADPLSSSIIQADELLGGIGTSSIGYSFSYDTRRTGLNPDAGVLLRFGQEFGFGDSQFIKTSAEATAQTLVLNGDVTLQATIEGGALIYQDGQSRITDRYFLGSRTMRGFAPGGIGPRDTVSGDALGGEYFAVARFEARFPLGLPEEYGISGGVFVDYGSVWDVGGSLTGNVEYNDFTPRSIAGVAIFWDTPIGPLRFNFTEPLNVQANDETKSFDLTISTQF